jgi:DNA-binding response OmpR family regulator
MKVLFVDDEVDLLEIASGFFEDENISLDTASDFTTALSMIKSNQYDVIISDANMPTGSGIELFSIVNKDQNYKGKLILATGEMESPAWRKQARYDLVINKPLNFVELVDKVKSLIR